MPTDHYREYGVSSADARNPKYRKYLKSRGWHNESYRHSLAARGIVTGDNPHTVLNGMMTDLRMDTRMRTVVSRFDRGLEPHAAYLFIDAIRNARPHEARLVNSTIIDVMRSMNDTIERFTSHGKDFRGFTDDMHYAVIQDGKYENHVYMPLRPFSIYGKVHYIVNMAGRK